MRATSAVVLTFERCGAYAAAQDADSTAVGWGQSYASAVRGRVRRRLRECRSRGGGSGCMVRVWGCNSPVVEEALGLDRAARRQIQQGLRSAGFDPGGADGLFGSRTRAAIRGWQSSRGARPTGYLDGPGAEALRTAGASGPAAQPASSPSVPAAQPAAPAASAVQENLFWQSIMNSTNPAEFEAYLARFPNGVSSALAQARLAALRAPANGSPAVAGHTVGRGRVSDDLVTSLRLSGFRHGCAGPRHSGWRRCASASGGSVPGLRGVSGDGGAAGGRSGAGSLRGDGGRVSSVRGGRRAAVGTTAHLTPFLGGTPALRKRIAIR